MTWRLLGVSSPIILNRAGTYVLLQFLHLYGGKGQPHAHQIFLEFLSLTVFTGPSGLLDWESATS